MRWAIAVVALGLAACSSGGTSGADVGEAATRVAPSTSTTISADDSFLAEVSVRMGWRGSDGEAALTTATAVCDTLTSSVADDPGVDHLMDDVALDLAFDEYTGTDELLAELLVIGVEHLCPQHQALLSGYIDTLGVTVPA